MFVLPDLSGWAERDADESIGQRGEEARGAEETAGKARGTPSAVYSKDLMIVGREEGEGRQSEEGAWRICCCCCCPCTTFGIEHAG